MQKSSSSNCLQKTFSERKNRIPQWQLDKMKSIIADRWDEVWHFTQIRVNKQ
ncbi:MAG: hypothetical protein RLZZ381_2944 [Cyanobacteriota bacterium]|jgi:hypothetical protein